MSKNSMFLFWTQLPADCQKQIFWGLCPDSWPPITYRVGSPHYQGETTLTEDCPFQPALQGVF